jgi:ABC-type bacteriocin/lantibiotic exporter with double-glycine peptidase domain
MLVYKDLRQQKAHTCGPVAARIVAANLGTRYTEEFLEDRFLCSSLDGTDPRSISAFFRSESFSVLDGQMEVADLHYFTKNNRPVIALVTFGGVGHYIVVRGVARKRVYYQDPYDGPASMPTESFSESWLAENYLGANFSSWGIVIWRS